VLIADPRAISTINEFSHRIAKRMGMPDPGHELDWPQGLVGETVYEGTMINLGNIDVQIMETPGHSSCSISAYVPRLRALFPSDGGGIPYKDIIVAAPNSNFIQYEESLRKIEPLRVECLCADHFGYICGDEALSYLSDSIKAAEEERARFTTIYHRLGNSDVAVKEAAASFLAQNPDYFLSPDIYEGICHQMMKQIAKSAGG
jgi:2-aminobenzoylacetyl-CoA thioesterase